MGSSKPGFNMNGLVVLAACVCASSAQVLVGGYAGAINPAPSSQFHAQDEFGQFSFGHAGGPSARTEARNAYGVTTGSYQYIDANGLLQTVNYIADPVNGFRVAGTNLPVAPAAVAAAAAAPEEAAAERKRRDADEAVAAPAAVLPYPYAGLLGGVYAAQPGAIVANIAHAVPTVAATYAAAPYAAAVATPLAAAAPVVAAAPSREAVLTTVKLNPGHAISYRVD